MNNKITFLIGFILLFFCIGTVPQQDTDSKFLSFVIDASKIHFYWKNDKGEILGSLQNLKSFTASKNQELIFAMNGGMYRRDQSPQGLYIENGKIITALDTSSGFGNFYLKPNGVFFLTNNKANICSTNEFKQIEQVTFATQSGPMLIINGQMHPAFKKGSTNLNIRNGVGILPDNRVLFAMSKKEINFYDFAEFFKSKGCKNALYLDGFVSRTYFPEQNWKQLDGNFGVMIGVLK